MLKVVVLKLWPPNQTVPASKPLGNLSKMGILWPTLQTYCTRNCQRGPSNLYDASICLIITGLENWKDTHRERGGHRKSTELEMKLQSSLAGQNKKNLSIFLNYCHLATSTCIWHCLWAGHCTTCWSIILNQMIFTYKYFLHYVQNSKICSVSIHNFQL